MAAGEVARGDADRDRGEQRRQQGDEVEKLLGAVERLPHLGPAGGERLDAQAAQACALISASAQSTNAATLASLAASAATARR